MTTDIIGFVICSLLIVFSGNKLSHHGNRIAEITGWGKAWVGLILVASVTSLPELITGISSVAIVKSPNLAAGDVIGSCVFNLLILSLIDAGMKKPLSSLVKQSHLVAGLFGIILLTIVAFALIFSDKIPPLLWISPFTPILVCLYLLTVWGIFHYDRSNSIKDDPVKIINENKSIALQKSFTAYGFNALIVAGAAIFLPYFGKNIATLAELGNTFFGTLFLAAATSMPELVVSIAAVRIGAYDLSVGNLFGSNVFNLLILGIDDLFYRKGPLFTDISSSHLVSILATIVMTAVAGLGMLIKPQRKIWLFGIDAFIILIIYAGLMLYLYYTKAK